MHEGTNFDKNQRMCPFSLPSKLGIWSIIGSIMSKEIMPITLPDPEISEAHITAKKLTRDCGLCQNPLTKKIFEKMAVDAYKYEKELKAKFRATRTVKHLHELQKPNINLN